MRRFFAVALLAAVSVVGCAQTDGSRTDRVNIDGVDCVVTRDGLGRITRTDCDWNGTYAPPKGQ